MEHIPHGQTKFLVNKFCTRDTPKWSYRLKCSEEFRENGHTAGAKPLQVSIGRAGVVVVTLKRLADCEQPNIDYRS